MDDDSELMIRVALVNQTKGYRFGDWEPTPVPTNDMSELFRKLRGEWGRCTGKVYIDTKSRGTVHCGWVFLSRQRYEDCADTYLREVWVTLEEEDGRSVDIPTLRREARR